MPLPNFKDNYPHVLIFEMTISFCGLSMHAHTHAHTQAQAQSHAHAQSHIHIHTNKSGLKWPGQLPINDCVWSQGERASLTPMHQPGPLPGPSLLGCPPPGKWSHFHLLAQVFDQRISQAHPQCCSQCCLEQGRPGTSPGMSQFKGPALLQAGQGLVASDPGFLRGFWD